MRLRRTITTALAAATITILGAGSASATDELPGPGVPTESVEAPAEVTLPLIAHRGFLGAGAGEMTHASFRHAIDRGYAGIEFDVRTTKDNRAVLMHDSTLNRTTNCAGYVSSWTLADIDRKCRITDGSKVPTLSGAMAYLNSFKAWDGVILFHAKETYSASEAKGIVSSIRRLSNEEQRVLVMVDGYSKVGPLKTAGWDGRDEGRSHSRQPHAPGVLHQKSDVERFGLGVGTSAEWASLSDTKRWQAAFNYQPMSANGRLEAVTGYDATVTAARKAVMVHSVLFCMPSRPVGVEELLALGACDALLVDH